MHAFDYLTILFSFVFALAITHLLAAVGDLIVAGRRVIFSWLHAGWMLAILCGPVAWWLGLWELRHARSWPMPVVGLFFLLAGLLYLLSRMVSPRIEREGMIDLKAYHRTEGPKYMAAFAGLAALTVVINLSFVIDRPALSLDWLTKNAAVAPMAVAALTAALVKDTRVQFAALAVVLVAWAVYFGELQGALTD
jgi:hypothetical protein